MPQNAYIKSPRNWKVKKHSERKTKIKHFKEKFNWERVNYLSL